MRHVGDFDTGSTVHGDFSTFNPSTGATIAFVGGKLAVVKGSNRAITNTAGVTLATSVGGIAGCNGWSVDASQDPTAYSADEDFSVIALSGTVNSVDIKGSVVGSFTLRKARAKADVREIAGLITTVTVLENSLKGTVKATVAPSPAPTATSATLEAFVHLPSAKIQGHLMSKYLKFAGGAFQGAGAKVTHFNSSTNVVTWDTTFPSAPASGTDISFE